MTKGRWAAVALQLALAAPAAAQGGIERLFPAQPSGWVTDAAGILDAATAQAITARIERLRAATGAELAIVTLPTIEDYAAVEVAVAIGRAWGVGQRAEIGDPRRNTGLVVLLVPRREGVPRSGQIFIATGQGLEGIVTDAAAGRVRDLMVPYFSRGDYSTGLQVGVEALSALIARGFGVADSALAAGDRHLAVRRAAPPIGSLILVALAVLVVLLVAGAILGSRTAVRAPAGHRTRRRGPPIFLGGPGFGGGFGGFGGGFGGGGFGGFGGGGGFSGGGAGGRF